MKLLVFLCLVAVAFCNDCSEERAEACVDSLLTAILGDTTEEEVCNELRTSIVCLRSAADDCLGDERDEEVEEGLQELEKILKDNCEEAGEESDKLDEEMQKCFAENEDYIYECIYEGATKALSLFMGKNVDENTIQCVMYDMMAGCFVERVGEKCGSQAADMAKEELEDLPAEIQAACEASASIVLEELNLLGDKRKRK